MPDALNLPSLLFRQVLIPLVNPQARLVIAAVLYCLSIRCTGDARWTMTRVLMPNESESLANAERLLRFAAEHIKELPEATVSSISAAIDAQQANTWDQKIATDFWLAFNSLCILIRPVTLETISTSLRDIPVPKWKVWIRTPKPISLAGRTADRYLSSLTFLLVVVLILSFLVSTAGDLSKETYTLIESADELTEKMVLEIDQLEPTIGGTKFPVAEAKYQEKIALLQTMIAKQDSLRTQMMQKTDLMWRLVTFGFRGRPFIESEFPLAQDIPELRNEVSYYRKLREEFRSDLLKASIVLKLIGSSIFPLLLGFMGACAYIVRLISDEIRDTTFSQTSPIQHLVRVAVGGLAGVVVGLTGIASAANLSPSALAFIAGYAVEPVFATFDSIAEKFRR